MQRFEQVDITKNGLQPHYGGITDNLIASQPSLSPNINPLKDYPSNNVRHASPINNADNVKIIRNYQPTDP